MLTKHMNMICKRGHRFYSPNPDYWINRPPELNKCGQGGCEAPLYALDPTGKAQVPHVKSRAERSEA